MILDLVEKKYHEVSSNSLKFTVKLSTEDNYTYTLARFRHYSAAHIYADSMAADFPMDTITITR